MRSFICVIASSSPAKRQEALEHYRKERTENDILCSELAWLKAWELATEAACKRAAELVKAEEHRFFTPHLAYQTADEIMTLAKGQHHD